jgi:hypothetical protein
VALITALSAAELAGLSTVKLFISSPSGLLWLLYLQFYGYSSFNKRALCHSSLFD